jgi:hypothetical protein
MHREFFVRLKYKHISTYCWAGSGRLWFEPNAPKNVSITSSAPKHENTENMKLIFTAGRWNKLTDMREHEREKEGSFENEEKRVIS